MTEAKIIAKTRYNREKREFGNENSILSLL